MIHAEHEAGVHHDSELVESPDRSVVVAADVVRLSVVGEVRAVHRFEADEERSEACLGGSFDEVTVEDRLHGAGRLPHPVSTCQPCEQLTCEALVTEEVM